MPPAFSAAESVVAPITIILSMAFMTASGFGGPLDLLQEGLRGIRQLLRRMIDLVSMSTLRTQYGERAALCYHESELPSLRAFLKVERLLGVVCGAVQCLVSELPWLRAFLGEYRLLGVDCGVVLCLVSELPWQRAFQEE